MELWGLTGSEYDGVVGLLDDKRKRVQTGGGQSRPARDQGVARVLSIDADQLVYSPRDPRDCALFRFNPAGIQKTLALSGVNLEGDLVLTIAGVDYQLSCNVTTETLRSTLGFALRDCRATVFPGLWEFDFNGGGKWSRSAPSFTVAEFEPPEGDDETPVFNGGVILTDEGWVSETSDGDSFSTVVTRDWMPFLTGSVKPGAVGGACWNHAAGWLVLAWQCREFSLLGDPY